MSNIARLTELWDPQRMDALLLLADRKNSVGVDWDGDFHLADDGRVTKRAEGEVADFVYSGVGIIKTEPFAQDTRDVFRLAPFLFDAAEKGRLYGLALEGQWLHVGTPAAIGEAEAAIARAKA
jgi:MurNAc alpha-1-phosphate uridylyltransferase